MRWLYVLFAAFPLSVYGTTITMDFNGDNHGFTMTNSCSDGYTDAEYASLWPAIPGADGTYHVSKFCPHVSNLEPEVVLTRDDGGAFTLLGFDTNNIGARIRSSSGGEIFLAGLGINYCWAFSGPDCVWDITTDIYDALFSNVTWVSFCPDRCTNEHGIGLYDNIRLSYSVDEPSTLALVLLPLLALGFRKRYPQFFHQRRE